MCLFHCLEDNKANKDTKDKINKGIVKKSIAAAESHTKVVKVSKLKDKEFEALKTSLFIKTMKYDLVLINDYDDTLEQRVARLLTNDMGETLRTEVSYALIQEFKKFMYLVALEILIDKREKTFEKDMQYEDPKTKLKYYVAPYHPPYLIDLVWRFIIQEGQIYKDF